MRAAGAGSRFTVWVPITAPADVIPNLGAASQASRSSAEEESRDISLGIPKTGKEAEKSDRWSERGGPI